MAMAIISILIYVFMITFGGDLIVSILSLVSSNKIFIVSMTNFTMYLILVVIYFLMYKDQLKKDYKNLKKQDITIKTILLNYLILIGAGIIGQIIVTLIGIDPQQQSINQQGIEKMLKSNYFIFAASGVLIGPFAEEIIYRKAIFDIFDEKFKFNPGIVCILSGLLFGLIHVVLNINSENLKELYMAIPYVFQGFALSFMYVHYKRNIIVPIAVHILSNYIALMLMFMAPQ